MNCILTKRDMMHLCQIPIYNYLVDFFFVVNGLVGELVEFPLLYEGGCMSELERLQVPICSKCPLILSKIIKYKVKFRQGSKIVPF